MKRLKVGDVLVCKKNIKLFEFDKKDYFIKNFKYDIDKINSDMLIIKNFELTMNKKDGSYPYIYDYFYTLKELRLKKLKSL